MYLTYEEYKQLGFSKLDESSFSAVEAYAERYLDMITTDFYTVHELNEDTFLYRKKKFKESMAVQCDYLHLAGVSIQEAISQAPTSISIGRTHLELPNSVSSTVGSTMVCVEAYRLLSRTGLLYRGVGSQ